MKKKFTYVSRNFVFEIRCESDKVLPRIFDEFSRCLGLTKLSVLWWTIQIIMTSRPPE